MSVREALLNKAVGAFASRVTELIAQAGRTQETFTMAVSSAERNHWRVQAALDGKLRLTRRTVARWAEVLDTDPVALAQLAFAVPRYGRKPRAVKVPTTGAWHDGTGPVEIPLEVPSRETFSFVVRANGRADLALTLTDIPISDGMEIIGALQTSRVFRTLDPNSQERSWSPPILPPS